MFDSQTDTLVQFRLPSNWEVPESVGNRGAESPEQRDARFQKSAELGGMDTVLERNGALLSNVYQCLHDAGLKLVDAYAQKRYTPATEYRRDERPYMHVTFIFKLAELEQEKLRPIFDSLATRRWAYVSVRSSRGDVSRLCVTAKSETLPAIMLADVPDSEAASFGIVVKKSVPKDRRNPQPKEDERVPQKAPTVKLVSVSTPKPSMSAASDPQLGRLLTQGWAVESDNGATVVLWKVKDGTKKTMTHHRPKVAANRRR